MNAVHVPIDMMHLPQFREMRDAFNPPSPALAVLLWWLLWQELGYRMQNGMPTGRLLKAQEKGFLKTLKVEGVTETPEALLAILLNPEVGLLREDEEGYFCARFADLHRNASVHRSPAQKGGDMKAYRNKQARLEQDVMDLGLSLNKSKFVDGTGQPLDKEMSRKVLWVIKGCDNALFLPDRQGFLFTEALMQNALRVVQEFSQDEIHNSLLRIANNRGHPLIDGLTTDKLLTDFKSMVSRLPNE